MTSLLTTMFVPLPSSPTHQPLPPHCTLKQSSSCVTINSYTFLESPEPASWKSYSPTSRAAQLLRSSAHSSPSSTPTKPCINMSSPSSNARTRGQFKPRNATKGTTSYQLRQFAEATLGSGSLRKAVKLPEGEDINEWLAVNGKDHLGLKERDIDFQTDENVNQWSISTTRSISCTVQLQNSARPSHVRR